MEHPDRIFLRDHVILAEIGAFQSERGHDQRLRFNLTVDLRQPVSGADDHVDAVLSYDVLTQAVDTALADQRYNLVETLAERIAAEVLSHPRAARIEVTVEKLDRGPGGLGVSIIREAGRVSATGVATEARVLIWQASGAAAACPADAGVIVPDAPALPLPEGGDARRIALLALDQAAWALAGRLGVEVAETRTELDAAIHARRPVVWAPSRLAANAAEAGQTPMQLGLWLAARIGASRIDVALPPDMDLPALPEGLDLPIGRVTV
ncbi:MAG: dihydroneopterin aldolase [Paracoccus sp. (in: a-proteobacteria)]